MMALAGFVLHVTAAFCALLAGIGLKPELRASREENRATAFFGAASFAFTIGGFVLTVMS